jgi:hypothetical protein
MYQMFNIIYFLIIIKHIFILERGVINLLYPFLFWEVQWKNMYTH